MFKQNGLGLKDGGVLVSRSGLSHILTLGVTVDSLGGELFWSAGLSFISDLPRRPHWPLKSHLFFNVGRLDMLDRYRGIFPS